MSGIIAPMEQAIAEMGGVFVANPIEDQEMIFGESLEVDISDVFTHPDNADLTYTYDGTSDSEIAEAELNGNILTITAGFTMGLAEISVRATADDEDNSEAVASFIVQVLSPNLVSVEYSVEDSPEQLVYPNNNNPYSNSLTDLGWTEIVVEETETLATVVLNLTWESVDYPSEGSLELMSPSGAVYPLYSASATGAEVLELAVPGAAGEAMNGTWSLYILDSYGDGGHQVTNCTVSFVYEGEAATGTLAGLVSLEGEGDLSAVEIAVGGNTINPDTEGNYSVELAAGLYTLTANLEGYEEYEMEVSIMDGETTTLDFEMIAEVSADEEIVFVNALQGNYPNPFNPTTNISYSVAEAGAVTLDIYNSKGQKVRSIVENNQAGQHSIVWNGKDNHGLALGSGVYFYTIKTADFSASKKMILLK